MRLGAMPQRPYGRSLEWVHVLKTGGRRVRVGSKSRRPAKTAP